MNSTILITESSRAKTISITLSGSITKIVPRIKPASKSLVLDMQRADGTRARVTGSKSNSEILLTVKPSTKSALRAEFTIPLSVTPKKNEIFHVRLLAGETIVKTANIEDSEQLLSFLTEASQGLKAVVNVSGVSRDLRSFRKMIESNASFRASLKGAVAGREVSPASLARRPLEKIGDVADAACGVAAISGANPVSAFTCGFALGIRIGDWLWGD